MMTTDRLHVSHQDVDVGISYNHETGRVALDTPRGRQVVFRLAIEGIYVWCKATKEEVLIPWIKVVAWITQA